MASSAPLKPPAGPVAPSRPVTFVPHGKDDPLSLAEIRLNALERLTLLVEKGTISLEEFRMEKALILRLTGDELLLTDRVEQPAPARSGWRTLPGLIAVGVFLTLVTVPQAAFGLVNRALTALGA